MKVFKNIYTPNQFSDYNLLSFRCWLRGKLQLTLLNDKVKAVNSCVKNDIDLNKYGSKLVGYRRFYLSNYIWNFCHTIVLTGIRMKPSK